MKGKIEIQSPRWQLTRCLGCREKNNSEASNYFSLEKQHIGRIKSSLRAIILRHCLHNIEYYSYLKVLLNICWSLY